MFTTTKRFRGVLALVTLVAALSATGVMGGAVASAAPESPSATGCGAGFALLEVTWFAEPYVLPGLVDSPYNGGNDNGLVCGLELPSAVRDAACKRYGDGSPVCAIRDLGLPVYNFKDDSIQR